MMKHAHEHTHPGQNGKPGITHSHFHEHEEDRDPDLAYGESARKAHKAAPHEHEHRTRTVTIPLTITVGTLEDIGLGGFKVGWLASEKDGRAYSLTAGAGVGSVYLEASVTGPEDQPSVYAQADIRPFTRELWGRLEAIQDELAAAEAPGLKLPAENSMTAEQIAQAFHETYERLAPDFGYKTREASARPWAEVPGENKALMIAVVQALLDADVLTATGG